MSNVDVEQEFRAARKSQAEGYLDQAKRQYGEVLARVPHHAESMTMLASIAYQQSQEAQAEAYLDRAIGVYLAVLERMPKMVRARAPVINLLLARGRQAEAEALMPELELRLNPIRATPKEFTQRRRYGQERGLPAMLVNALPKTASESIWNKLAQGLGIGQGHITIGLFPRCILVPLRVQAALEGGFIAKEHLPATPFNIKTLADHGLTKTVCHLRDPRQATLSWAHFVRDDVSIRMLAPIWRQIVPPAEVLKAHFPVIVDWCIDNYLPLLTQFLADWIALEQRPDSPVEVRFLTFESFLKAPDDYIQNVLSLYDIDPKHFRAEAESKIVHLRKGQTDEWRSVFTVSQQERAWSLIPDDMAARFGWQA
ncbi:MAG: hypothetical protein AAF495_08695 [Pseudomonadota bacterium]